MSLESKLNTPFLIGSGVVEGKHQIDKDSFYIGRDDDVDNIKNDIHVSTDRAISRQHMRIIKEDNNFFIEDLGSLCGTYVNSQKIGEDTSHLGSHSENYNEYKKLNKGKIKLNEGDKITLSQSAREDEYSFIFSLGNATIDTSWKRYKEKALEHLKKEERMPLRDIRKGMYLSAKEKNELDDSEFKELFEKVNVALGIQLDRDMKLQEEIEQYVKNAGLKQVDFDKELKNELEKIAEDYTKKKPETDIKYLKDNLYGLTNLAWNKGLKAVALCTIYSALERNNPEAIEWAIEEINSSLPYTAPEALDQKFYSKCEEAATHQKVSKDKIEDYLNLREVAFQASNMVDKGENIKGILVKEDIYYAFQKAESGFNGVIGLTGAKGRTEFYIRPVTEKDQKKLEIEKMGPYGVVFTPLSKEELEKKLE